MTNDPVVVEATAASALSSSSRSSRMQRTCGAVGKLRLLDIRSMESNSECNERSHSETVLHLTANVMSGPNY